MQDVVTTALDVLALLAIAAGVGTIAAGSAAFGTHVIGLGVGVLSFGLVVQLGSLFAARPKKTS